MFVHELKHNLGKHFLTQLRSKDTTRVQFRHCGNGLGRLLFAEATRDLAIDTVDCESPLNVCDGYRVQSPVFIPILRAGFALLEVGFEFFPEASVSVLGVQRDEETAQPVFYYQKFTELKDKDVFILEPMLATGGTLKIGLGAIEKYQPKSISIISFVAAPEGIECLKDFSANLYLASIDEGLNDKKYIVPGLGDFGDRWFGSTK